MRYVIFAAAALLFVSAYAAVVSKIDYTGCGSTTCITDARYGCNVGYSGLPTTGACYQGIGSAYSDFYFSAVEGTVADTVTVSMYRGPNCAGTAVNINTNLPGTFIAAPFV